MAKNIGSITIFELGNQLPLLYKLREPLIVTGPVGIGKTEVIRSFTKNNDLELTIFTLSNMDTPDIRGLVSLDESTNRMVWYPPVGLPYSDNTHMTNSLFNLAEYLINTKESNSLINNSFKDIDIEDLFTIETDTEFKTWIDKWSSKSSTSKKAFKYISFLLKNKFPILYNIHNTKTKENSLHKGGIILLDEMKAASPHMQITANQLLLERCIGEYKLPDNWVVWATGNNIEDGMIAYDNAASDDRMTHYRVKVDVESFINWGVDNNIHPSILTFLKAHPEYVHFQQAQLLANKSSSSGDEYFGPTPRSWAVVSKMIYEINIEDINRYTTSIVGRLGLLCTRAFISSLKESEKLPNIEDLLKIPIDKKEQINRLLPVTQISLWTFMYSLMQYLNSTENVIKIINILNLLTKPLDGCSREDIRHTGMLILTKKFVNLDYQDDKGIGDFNNLLDAWADITCSEPYREYKSSDSFKVVQKMLNSLKKQK